MTSKLRLIFHVPTLGSGGAERVMVILANELARRGHGVTLLVWNSSGPNAALVEKNVKLLSLDMPSQNGGFGKIGTLLAILRTIAVFDHQSPDAVFSALEFANGLTALALTLSRSKARFYPTYHAAGALTTRRMAYSLLPLLDRLTIRKARRAIGVSTGVSRELVARGFKPAQVVTIPNPVRFSAPDVRQAPHWKQKLADWGAGPLIVTLGRLVEVKDHRTLLKAFQHLHADMPSRLAIFGEGPLKAELESYAAELGIAHRVLFAGYTDDPASCYEAADLFVLSSTSEGFGNVLVEALSAGLPVVSTDAPHGPREILADGEYGELVPVGDAVALAAAMARTLSRPADRNRLKARAGAFSVEAAADRYEALLTGQPD